MTEDSEKRFKCYDNLDGVKVGELLDCTIWQYDKPITQYLENGTRVIDLHTGYPIYIQQDYKRSDCVNMIVAPVRGQDWNKDCKLDDSYVFVCKGIIDWNDIKRLFPNNPIHEFDN